MIPRNILGCMLVFTLAFVPSVYAGKVELTTYYPSPYGEYTTLKAPGMAVQTVVGTSTTTSSLNATTFTEPNSAYRVSITPKFASSTILVEYSFSINSGLASNVIFHMQLVRGIGGSETLVGVGPSNGSRNRTSYVSRPNNGYDTNDMQNVYMVGVDSGLTAGQSYTYGFKYRSESGGTTYFNYSSGDSSAYGFSGVMTMKITEIAA